jgi:hypothetical protein
LREKLSAYVCCEIAVDGEIEPLEDVSDQSGQRSASRRLRVIVHQNRGPLAFGARYNPVSKSERFGYLAAIEKLTARDG